MVDFYIESRLDWYSTEIPVIIMTIELKSVTNMFGSVSGLGYLI